MGGVYLLLGSNLGDRVLNLRRTSAALNAAGIRVIECSDFYETAPWGNSDQPAFINQAIAIDTGLEPLPLLEKLKAIEQETGREENIRWGPRKIDIDILLYHDQQINTDRLEIPHPRMAARRFTLLPLVELAGEAIHPGNGHTINRLLADCPDDLPAHRYCNNDFHYVTYVVKGKVQGVGFRKHVFELANALGIKGFVLNRDDGGVEIHAEGTADNLTLFWTKVKAGTLNARVDKGSEQEKEPYFFPDFIIRK